MKKQTNGWLANSLGIGAFIPNGYFGAFITLFFTIYFICLRPIPVITINEIGSRLKSITQNISFYIQALLHQCLIIVVLITVFSLQEINPSLLPSHDAPHRV
jgi:uncharacterized membrane protein YfhO